MEKSLCIVLRTADYRDNDKMLTLFSRETGRIDALSRGCKKTTSSLLACSELFTCGLFSYYIRQGKYFISQCEIFDSFYPLREDIERFSVAALLAEVCEKTIDTGEPAPKLFSLAANSFFALKENDPLAVLAFFLVKFTDVTGYMPQIHTCIDCGKKAAREGNFFSTSAGGLVCSDCSRNMLRVRPVSAAALKTMHEILKLPVKNAASFSAEGGTLKELKTLLLEYVEDKIDYRLSTAQFLDKVL
jgi:DNA repair protein RecO (recombination protein O)